MNKEILMLAFLGAVLWHISQKNAAAEPALSRSAPIADKNLNDDMWSRLMGDAWTSLRGGSAATSDGKPTYSGNDSVDQWQTNLRW